MNILSYKCSNCDGDFGTKKNLLNHIQFDKTCFCANGTLFNNFGKENIDLVCKDMYSFLKLYNIVNNGDDTVVDIIEYIYFNPDIPENQTLKYDSSNMENIFIYTNGEWEKRLFGDISYTIYTNIELVYLKFFEKLVNIGVNDSFILNCIDKITDVLKNKFYWNCDFIEEIKTYLINKKESLEPVYDDEYLKFLDLTNY